MTVSYITLYEVFFWGVGGPVGTVFFLIQKDHVKRQHVFVGTGIKALIHYISSGMSFSPHLCNVLAQGVS